MSIKAPANTPLINVELYKKLCQKSINPLDFTILRGADQQPSPTVKTSLGEIISLDIHCIYIIIN